MTFSVHLIDDDGVVSAIQESAHLDWWEWPAVLEEAVAAQEAIDFLRARLNELHVEMKRRLQQDGATEYVGENGKAKLVETGASYDHLRLNTLLEVLTTSELVEAGALVEPYEKVVDVPRSWNVTKLRPFAKRGKVVADIIAAARIPGNVVVKVDGKQ